VSNQQAILRIAAALGLLMSAPIASAHIYTFIDDNGVPNFSDRKTDPRARSPKGAMGLTQLMPATAERYGVKNAYDAKQNLHGGARYLADLLVMFDNDVHLALAAFNAGEGAVMKYGRKIPPYAETQRYVPQVLAQLNLLRKDARSSVQ
jgi:hypothetical protein